MAGLLLASLVLSVVNPNIAKGDDPGDTHQTRVPTIQEVGGRDRIETAVALSRQAFPNGAQGAVIARADEYADALAGSPLAATLEGPLLLTHRTRLDTHVGEELRRLGAREVVLLGGHSALSEAVQDGVAELGLTVERLAGANRFETAAKVAQALPDARHGYVVEGTHRDKSRGWPDAVAVSSLAAHQSAPILLVGHNELPSETRTAITSLQAVTIVGGTVAVSDSVAHSIKSTGPSVRRIQGYNRYDTSARIANEHRKKLSAPFHVWLGTGHVFADALAAGPASAAMNGILVLVDGLNGSGSKSSTQWLSHHSGELGKATFVGGEQAIAVRVRDELTRTLHGRRADAARHRDDGWSGLHYNAEEVAIWRRRAAHGPYREANDVSANSPGDWHRIRDNAAHFLSDPRQARWSGPVNNNPGGCVQVDSAYPSSNPPGNATIRLRDAAFYYLITQDTRYREAVKTELLWFARQPGIDFSNNKRWCKGSIWDLPPSWDTAIWMSRLLYAYDYLGVDSFTGAERQQLNDWFYNAANFWQADLNASHDRRFRDRWNGDYLITDDYVRACNSTSVGYQGSKTICALPKFYNNRKAHVARFVTSAGIKLEREGYNAPGSGISLHALKRTGKLFGQEWLMFSVYPEGFFGEFERWTNSLPILGWAYTAGVMSPVATIADELARSGDASLMEFTTRDGAHGTTSAGGRDWLTGEMLGGTGVQKSLRFAIQSYARYVDGSYVRYGTNSATRATADYRIRSFHAPSDYYSVSDVGLAMANVYYRDSSIKAMYMRTGTGMPGYPVRPADGGLHGWMAHGGTYPGVLLMFGQMEGKVWPY